jgi:hypothetical protein
MSKVVISNYASQWSGSTSHLGKSLESFLTGKDATFPTGLTETCIRIILRCTIISPFYIWLSIIPKKLQ